MIPRNLGQDHGARLPSSTLQLTGGDVKVLDNRLKCRPTFQPGASLSSFSSILGDGLGLVVALARSESAGDDPIDTAELCSSTIPRPIGTLVTLDVLLRIEGRRFLGSVNPDALPSASSALILRSCSSSVLMTASAC